MKSMTMVRVLSAISLVIATSLFEGCAARPARMPGSAQQDQSMQLAEGEGIAAVQLDVSDVQPQLLLKMGGNDQVLEIRDPPMGQSLYLFKVHAGRYCMTQFYSNKQKIYPKDMGCFTVAPGEVAFSGYLSPKVVDGLTYIDQSFRVDDAEDQLKQLYPDVAARFLKTSAPSTNSTVGMKSGAMQPGNLKQSATGPDDRVTTWLEHEPSHTESIYFHNNTNSLAMITAFQLHDCTNIKQGCDPLTPYFSVPPHATMKFMDVEAADQAKPHIYRYVFKLRFETAVKMN
jgi:hypothetical protein